MAARLPTRRLTRNYQEICIAIRYGVIRSPTSEPDGGDDDNDRVNRKRPEPPRIGRLDRDEREDDRADDRDEEREPNR